MGGPQAPLFLSNNVCEKKYKRIYNCVGVKTTETTKGYNRANKIVKI
jgi:hypothetical protein